MIRGAQRGQMDQTFDTGSSGRSRNDAGALHMHALKGGAAARGQNSDKIDDPVGTGDGARNRGFVGNIRGDGRNLPHPAHNLKIQRFVRTARCYANEMALFRQARTNGADEAARRRIP